VNRKQALARAREILIADQIEDVPLEAELLLRHILDIDRVQLYRDIDYELSAEQHQSFWQLVERRLKGEPSAYITGHREFYGLDFFIDRRVLIPRPESELLVEKAIELAQSSTLATVADIGTGCGAIAVSLALNLPGVKICAIDISPAALEVARLNCRRHGVKDRICLLQGDLLEPLPEPVDLIIANLPYVKTVDMPRTGTEQLSFEPPLALDGGENGLSKINRLCQQAGSRLNPRGALLLEIGQGQARPVIDLLGSLFPSARIEATVDLGGIERTVSLHLTENCPDDKIRHILSQAAHEEGGRTE